MQGQLVVVALVSAVVYFMVDDSGGLAEPA